ncbi:MAG: hypothetical protein WB791_05755 [Waddliaceae bacterium]
MANHTEVSQGVQELIDKLKNQGVEEGRQQANEMIASAQREASCIIADAKSEADKLLAEAHQKIEMERSSAYEAIHISFRDTELALRSKFREAFSLYLKRLVSYELQDKDFIKQLVLAIVGTNVPELERIEKLEVLVPMFLLETDEQGTRLSKKGKENMRHLVLGISGEMLREGVELKFSADVKGGIRIRLVGEDLEIDFSDECLSSLLLKHLLPRYRSIVSGQE